MDLLARAPSVSLASRGRRDYLYRRVSDTPSGTAHYISEIKGGDFGNLYIAPSQQALCKRIYGEKGEKEKGSDGQPVGRLAGMLGWTLAVTKSNMLPEQVLPKLKFPANVQKSCMSLPMDDEVMSRLVPLLRHVHRDVIPHLESGREEVEVVQASPHAMVTFTKEMKADMVVATFPDVSGELRLSVLQNSAGFAVELRYNVPGYNNFGLIMNRRLLAEIVEELDNLMAFREDAAPASSSWREMAPIGSKKTGETAELSPSPQVKKKLRKEDDQEDDDDEDAFPSTQPMF